MPPFDYASSPHPVRADIRAAHTAFWERLPEAGEWWTGAARIAIAAEAREAWAQRTQPPWLRSLPDIAEVPLPEPAVEAVRAVAVDVHRIDEGFAARTALALGDAAYVELVALAVQTIAVDAFAAALGVPCEPLPTPRDGKPGRSRPGGVGDIRAHVECLLDYAGPNVGRAMSLAPNDNATFLGLVGSMYALADFMEMVWKDRPLSRPQVELVAARVSAVNECFY